MGKQTSPIIRLGLVLATAFIILIEVLEKILDLIIPVDKFLLIYSILIVIAFAFNRIVEGIEKSVEIIENMVNQHTNEIKDIIENRLPLQEIKGQDENYRKATELIRTSRGEVLATHIMSIPYGISKDERTPTIYEPKTSHFNEIISRTSNGWIMYRWIYGIVKRSNFDTKSDFFESLAKFIHHICTSKKRIQMDIAIYPQEIYIPIPNILLVNKSSVLIGFPNKKGDSLDYAIYINDVDLYNHLKDFFDSLWENSIPIVINGKIDEKAINKLMEEFLEDSSDEFRETLARFREIINNCKQTL